MFAYLKRCLLGIPLYQITVEGETLDGHTVRLQYQTHHDLTTEARLSQRQLVKHKLEKWYCTHIKATSIRFVDSEKLK
jgi:hypothetical protein